MLSVPENEIPFEAWVQFHHSVQVQCLIFLGEVDISVFLLFCFELTTYSAGYLCHMEFDFWPNFCLAQLQHRLYTETFVEN